MEKTRWCDLQKSEKQEVWIEGIEMNVISFSLWGDNPKYTIGAIKNAMLAKDIYPGWICRFYLGRSVPEKIKKGLIGFDNTHIIEIKQ